MALAPTVAKASAPVAATPPPIDQAKSIEEQYAQMKALNQARADEAARNAGNLYTTLAAGSGGFGGAGIKLAEQAQGDLANKFSQNEMEIGAQKAGAYQQLGAQQQASLEAEKQRKFEAEQAALGRTQAGEQFKAQLQFAQNSWLAEFKENQKTNWVNALTALKDAHIKSPSDWKKLYGTLQALNIGPGYSAGTLNLRGGISGAAEPQLNPTGNAGLGY